MSSATHTEWLKACPAAELPPGERKLVKLNNVEVALFNLNGTVYAIKNRCPHRSGPLIRGFVDDKAGIKCPFYNVKSDGTPTGADDPRLNEFNPDIFLISGVPSDGRVIRDPRVAVRANAGETILVRPGEKVPLDAEVLSAVDDKDGGFQLVEVVQW